MTVAGVDDCLLQVSIATGSVCRYIFFFWPCQCGVPAADSQEAVIVCGRCLLFVVWLFFFLPIVAGSVCRCFPWPRMNLEYLLVTVCCRCLLFDI